MRLVSLFFIFFTALSMASSCGGGTSLPTVDEVDLEKYSGTWFEIAHLPQSFQKNCRCTEAEYTLEDGYVRVVNKCFNSEKGGWESVTGKAFPVKGTDNSRLKVQFFWPFRGDYDIIALGNNYQTAMVGAPDRESLWILSRSKEPGAETVKEYLNKAEELGFNTEDMIFTRHDCN